MGISLYNVVGNLYRLILQISLRIVGNNQSSVEHTTGIQFLDHLYSHLFDI